MKFFTSSNPAVYILSITYVFLPIDNCFKYMISNYFYINIYLNIENNHMNTTYKLSF
jgi:hypothetical protein